ncbi:glycosyltransferase [Winogradskyella sp.]|nr:glycosyltransferase [Winogradskyella sp.]
MEATNQLGYKLALTPHLSGQFYIKGNMRLFNEQNCDGKVILSRCMAFSLHDKGYAKPVAKILGRGISLVTAFKRLESKLPPVLYQASHRKNELNRIKQHTDVIFAIAPWIKKAFEANEISNAKLLPQGISPVFFEKDNFNLKEKENSRKVNFAFIGRVFLIKGFHFLQEAWDNLGNEKIELHVMTNPTQNENKYHLKYKSWADTKDNVVWNEGFLQNDEAVYLIKIDVLVFPSIAEVAPLVILEAATRKIPTLASDYIAMKDMIQDNVNGWLFENRNAEALKQQLSAIIAQPEQIVEMSKNIQPPHSMDEVAKIVESYINVSK